MLTDGSRVSLKRKIFGTFIVKERTVAATLRVFLVKYIGHVFAKDAMVHLHVSVKNIIK